MLLIDIIVVLLLVAANGFFVACEFALVAVRPSRLQQLKEAGEARARVVEYLLKDLDRTIAGAQVGITMASLALGWLGEVTLAGWLEPVLVALHVPWATVVAHAVAITVAFLAITMMHVVLGEQVPKSMALQRAERIALLVARPMAAFMAAFRPLISVFGRASNVALRAMGYRASGGHALVRSAEELRLLLHQVHEHGVVGLRQARMLEGALELDVVEVRQVMTPRRDMVCLPAHASLEHTLDVIRARRRSRYPVYENTPEQVIGAVHAKDIFRHLEERLRRVERGEKLPPFDLRPFVRECLFVPETRPLSDLLEDFRRQRVHLAIVVDEFGSVQGMVTLADALEPVVGQMRDEYETAPVSAPLIPQSGAGLVLDARLSLHDLEHQHRIELPAGPGFETLAGFILNRLGFIPAGGESFLYDGLRFTVLEMEGRRVARVKIERLAGEAPGDPSLRSGQARDQ